MHGLKLAAKRTLSSLGARRDARQRRPPAFAGVHHAADQDPHVYYLCPDSDVPTGGIRVIYRHVDLLNSIGVPATVVHRKPGFACTWFQHETPVAAAGTVRLSPADILVVPEFYGPYLSELPKGPRIVVFNQNTYKTFPDRERSVPEWQRAVASGQLKAILVVSRDNEGYARYAFPGTPVHRVRNSVDDKLFFPATETPGRRLAVMPRRRAKDCAQVLDLLAMRGISSGWDIVRIDGRSETDTAQLLRSCSLFLSFSDQEGFGMPPAEAMASGCYVIGFTGLAGREFFRDDFCSPVEEGDVLAFAKAAEDAMRHFEADGPAIRELALKGTAMIQTEYSPANQLGDLRAFFEALLPLDSHPCSNRKRGSGRVPPRPRQRPALERALPGDLEPGSTRYPPSPETWDILFGDGQWHRVSVRAWARDRYARDLIDIEWYIDGVAWMESYVVVRSKMRAFVEPEEGAEIE